MIGHTCQGQRIRVKTLIKGIGHVIRRAANQRTGCKRIAFIGRIFFCVLHAGPRVRIDGSTSIFQVEIRDYLMTEWPLHAPIGRTHYHVTCLPPPKKRMIALPRRRLLLNSSNWVRVLCRRWISVEKVDLLPVDLWLVDIRHVTHLGNFGQLINRSRDSSYIRIIYIQKLGVLLGKWKLVTTQDVLRVREN